MEPNLETSEGHINNEREALIDQIVERNHSAFAQWNADPAHRQKMDLPIEALQTLIPRRLYEIADDPEKVLIIPSSVSSNSILQAVMFERKLTPVSNPESLSTWIEAIKAKQEAEKTQAEEEGKNYRFRTPPAPDDIDEYHILFYRLLLGGKITAHDYITNDIALIGNFEPDILNVSEYNDRDDLRGKGVAKSFYSNLHSIAKQMGFRYITGSNNDRNLGFFTNTLGRSTLPEIKPEFRHKFHYKPDDEKTRTYTVDFLYEEDKSTFLQKEK
jgi:hypothetical protein